MEHDDDDDDNDDDEGHHFKFMCTLASAWNYSKTSLSGTPMGLAPSVPLNELSHLVKLVIINGY